MTTIPSSSHAMTYSIRSHDYYTCPYGLQMSGHRTYSMNIRPVLIQSLDAFIGSLQDTVLMNKLQKTDGPKSTLLICLRTKEPLLSLAK